MKGGFLIMTAALATLCAGWRVTCREANPVRQDQPVADHKKTPGQSSTVAHPKEIREEKQPVRSAAAASVSNLLEKPSGDGLSAAIKLMNLAEDTRAPAESRSAALSHLLNLSRGYEVEFLLPLLRNPALPASLCRAILADALNAPPSWQIEACLAAIASRAEPDIVSSARDHLKFLNDGEDLGEDPAAWKDALGRSLAKLDHRADLTR